MYGMKAVGKLLWHEAEYCFRDPRRFIFLFGASIIYMFIFGSLYAPGVVKSVPAVFCDEDQSAFSRHYLRDLADNDSFGDPLYVSTEEQLRQALREKQGSIGVLVPKYFSRDIKAGSHTTVLFFFNGENLVTTSIVARDGEHVTETFSNKVASQQLALRSSVDEQSLLQKIEPMETGLRVIGNTSQTYSWFFVIGLAIAAYQQGLFFAGAASLFQVETAEWQKYPAGLRTRVKMLFVWLMAMFSFVLMLGVMHSFWEVPLRGGHLWSVLALGAAFALAVTGLGFLWSACFEQELGFARVSLLYPVVGFILSGYTWPLLAMPKSLQLLAYVLPQTWMMNTFRDLLLVGSVAEVWGAIKVLSLMGLTFCLLAGIFVRRRLQRLSGAATVFS